MDIVRDIVHALDHVPEKRLRLIELARQCAGPDGQFDLARALPLAAEIEDAVEEARAYAKATEAVRWSLHKLMGR